MFGPKWQTLVAGTAAVALTLGLGSLSAAASAVAAPTAHPAVATAQPASTAARTSSSVVSTPARAVTPRVVSARAAAGRPAAGTRIPLPVHHGLPVAPRTAAAQRAAWAAAVAAGSAGSAGAAHPSIRQRLVVSAVAAAADSSLSGLSVGGNVTNVAPAFDRGTHDYQVLDYDDASVTVTATATAAGATVVVTSGGSTDALSGGVATVPVSRGRNDVTITVTSADASSSTVTRLTVWRLAAPTSRVVSITDATATVFGGTYARVTLANGELPTNGGCYRRYTVGGQQTGTNTSTFDPATGFTTDAVFIPTPATRAGGTADLVLTNHCNFGDVQATTTAPNAVTYTTTLHVDSVDVPAAVTSGTPIVVNGAGITEYSDVAFWLTNAAGVSAPLDSWDFTTNNATTVYPDYATNGPAGEAWYAGSGPRTLHVGYCPPDTYYFRADLTTCTSVYARTVNWVAPVPAQLSFTPANGPTAGGTVIKLRGRFVLSGTNATTITVGGQTVPTWTVDTSAENDGNTFEQYTQGQDVIEFPAPASAVTGPQPITVTNDIGTTVAAGSFTYSAQPTITAITPAAVATSGGSVITVTGTAFGTAGTPSVIIAGAKSPSVTRVSATKLTAVVPLAAGAPGAVAVSVSSPQGGGISAAASLTLVAPTTLPTVTKITPTSGHVSDTVTLTGTGFGPAGTVGVNVGGAWALVTGSTATSVTFEVPPTDTTGLADLTVGATTGTVTRANGFTVLPDAGITTVTPATITSYATGAADRVALDGAGFGTTGTVKVGSARAVAYTATAGGTHIAGVVVSTTVAGTLLVTVTPTGSTTPLTGSVSVTAPAVTYVGPSPYARVYGPPDINQDDTGVVLDVATTGGVPMLVQGSGFGPTAGTVTVGTAAARVLSWTDTAVTFTTPAHAVGSVAVTVTPAHATLSAGQNPGVTYVPTPVGPPTVTRIASVVVHPRRQPDEFDPVNDVSNTFTLTGTDLTGTATAAAVAATRVVLSDGGQTFTVVPTAVTATSLTFAAPRGFTNGGWKDVQVTTTVGTVHVNYGLYYLGAGVSLTVSPFSGLCLQTATAATGGVTYTPAVITIANSGSLFGTAGTVTIDGVAITATSYTAGQVVLDLSHLPADLPNPWGGKAIVITPTAPAGLPTQTVGFDCAVTPSVTTTANGSPNDLTVAAGTTFTPGFTTTGFIAASGFSTPAPGGYEYVSAADNAATGFTRNVHAGIPAAAGDWYVRVALSRATYATADYLGFTPSAVHVTITGTPITITPAFAVASRSTVYKGQLGDGTNGTNADFTYTPSSTTDPITGVTWEYRDSVCESQAATFGWTDGLPKDVARSSTACGGDGTTVSKWDVRVKTFAMTTSGVDRSIYYQATLPTVQVTITPRAVTVAGARADKTYDATTAATFGNLTFTGEIDGDDLTLSGASTGSFADPAAGVNKPVTLTGPLTLGGGSAGDYTLTNPRPTIVGTIAKAATVLTLTGSTASILLTPATTVTMTAAVTDARTGRAVDSTAATPVLTSQTPGICTISGATVHGVAAGVCVIAGSDATSVNYLAATAASDPTSATETFTIQVFPARQSIAVVADDLTAAAGDTIAPTSEVSGLFTGDSVDGVTYTYYSGRTLLPGAPTTPGTYRVVPAGGTLHAADPSVYANPSAFTYVAGTLTLTAVPPTITTITPNTGSTAGGTRVTVTGTLLDTVKLIRIGSVILRAGAFTASPDGTALTFTTPPGAAGVVDVVLVNGTATATYPFTYTSPVVTAPGAPTDVVATGHDTVIDVSFLPPTATGGAPITGYQVSLDGGHHWTTVTTLPGRHGTRTAVITGVRNGTTYAVLVRAVNRAGAGAAAVVRHALPATTPSAPVAVHATGRIAAVALTFTVPVSDGGAPVLGYQTSIDGGHHWTLVPTLPGPGGTRTMLLTGLRNGTAYAVLLRAVNIEGAGAASAAATARTLVPVVLGGRPGLPTRIGALAGNGRIQVTFTPPVVLPGRAATGYQVSVDGGRTWHAVTTREGPHGIRTATVAGVANGIRYTVRVRAVNRYGAGPQSRARTAVPNAPPLGTVPPVNRAEVPIPADPAYHGPQVITRALNTSHNGTWAHPIATLGARQLTRGEAATLFKGSLFRFNSAALTPAGYAAVANLAGHLRLARAVTCEGYTDYAGNAGHEKTLSEQRAQAICSQLVHDGAHVTFTTHGYGGARPVLIGGTPQSRDRNRRVVVLVTH